MGADNKNYLTWRTKSPPDQWSYLHALSIRPLWSRPDPPQEPHCHGTDGAIAGEKPDWAPEADTARYFAQRAGAGLFVTGSIAISAWARTWAFEPGLCTRAQIEAWRLVANEVHDHGGVIFGQIRHGGRASHFSHQPSDREAGQKMVVEAAIAVGHQYDRSERRVELNARTRPC